MTTTTTIKINRYPRPKALGRAQETLNARFVGKAWAMEEIERIRDRIAFIDHHIQGGDIAGARAIVNELDAELDVVSRCLWGDIPDGGGLARSIIDRDRGRT